MGDTSWNSQDKRLSVGPKKVSALKCPECAVPQFLNLSKEQRNESFPKHPVSEARFYGSQTVPLRNKEGQGKDTGYEVETSRKHKKRQVPKASFRCVWLPSPLGRLPLSVCIPILTQVFLVFLLLPWLPSPAPLLLGKIKVKPKTIPRGQTTAAASSPFSCPLHGR